MTPIREIKRNNLRRLFYECENERPHLTYKEFGEILNERGDVVGKHLSGSYEISDDKIIAWCTLRQLPYSYFYDEHEEVPWPPEKRSYQEMTVKERFLLVAEECGTYESGTRSADKLSVLLTALCEEIKRCVPEGIIAKSPLLKQFMKNI